MHIAKFRPLASIISAMKEQRCSLCSEPFHPSGKLKNAPAFCPRCVEKLPRRVSGYCPLCGDLTAWSKLSPAPCLSCLKNAPIWENIFFYGAYADELRNAILRLKFKKEQHLARSLSRLLASIPELQEWAKLERPILVPVPLARLRMGNRGFNQSYLLAFHLAKALDLKVDSTLLKRIVHTLPQANLSRQNRKSNVENAFNANKAVAGKQILLVDDIMTTGATLHEACLTVKAAGARGVSLAVLARTQST